MVFRWLSARLPRRRSAKPVRRYLDADQPRGRALAATGTVSADGFDLVAGRAFVRLHRRDHLNGGNDASLDHEPFCGVDSDIRWTTQVWSPHWSSDGKSLFYVSNRGGTRDLWMQELNEDATPKGDPEPVTTGLGIWSVSVLADGTRTAYSKTDHFANVWRVPIFPDRAATSSDAEQLTFDQAYVEFLDISRDGRRLVVNSNRSGFVDLWTLPAKGREMQPVTNDPSPYWKPAWSPDGEDIAFYSNRAGNRDIFAVPSGDGLVRQLTTHTGGDTTPLGLPMVSALSMFRAAMGTTTSGSWIVVWDE